MQVDLRSSLVVDVPASYPAPVLGKVNQYGAEKFQRIFKENAVRRNANQEGAGKASASLWQSLLNIAQDGAQNPFLVMPKKDLLISALQNQFGHQIVKGALRRYRLEEKPNLTLSDYRALLIGIAASVTTRDLEALFNRLKNEQRAPWKDFASFKDLKDAEIGILMNHFRAHINPTEWKKLFAALPELYYQKALNRDIGFLNVCSMANDFRFDDQEVATSEYLGHEVAYSEMLKGRIIPVPVDGGIRYEKVSQYICKKGYVCGILTPLQEHQHLDKFGVRVLYRGTHDGLSASRLGERHSAGHFSFNPHQKRLINSIAAAIPKDAKESSVQFCGHSLGGADAARGLTSLVFIIACLEAQMRKLLHEAKNIKLGLRSFKKINLEKISGTIQKIKHVEARVWNAAGIAHSTNNRFRHWESVVNNATPKTRSLNDNDWTLVEDPSKAPARIPRLTLKVSEGKVGGDPVQQSGQTSLGHRMGFRKDTFEGEVIQFEHGFSGLRGCLCYLGRSGIKAHQVKNLNRAINNGKVAPYKRLSNKENIAKLEEATGDHLFAFKLLIWWEKLKWFVITFFFGNPFTEPPQED